MASLPPISLIIPVYNGSKFLQRAIESVLTQTLLPKEIILVDDASTDAFDSTIAEISNKIPLKIIRLSANSGGPAHPLNIAIAAATGEYISVLDQDDILHPEKLLSQTEMLSKYNQVNQVFSLSQFRSYVPPAGIIRGRKMLCLLLEQGNFVLSYSGFIFRKKSWQEKGGFDENFKIASDFDFICWLCLRGDAVFIPAVQYTKGIHEKNLSNQRNTPWEAVSVKKRYLQAAKSCGLSFSAARKIEQRYYYEKAVQLRNQGDLTIAWNCLIRSIFKFGPSALCLRGLGKLGLMRLRRVIGQSF